MKQLQNTALAILILLSASVVGAAAEEALTSDSKSSPIPPQIITRAEWGASPPTGPYLQHEINAVTIHHQGVFASPNQDARRRLKTMQAFHQSKKRGFKDIAYHYIIDRNGNIYEGRPLNAVGETKTDYDPKGHLLICLLGDFNVQEPTKQQLSALTALILWSLDTFHLLPDAVKGHRDYAHTDCPGKNLYRLIHNKELTGSTYALQTGLSFRVRGGAHPRFDLLNNIRYLHVYHFDCCTLTARNETKKDGVQ
jgi:hypothetical protein